jgi:hypothetical protein
MKGEENRTNVLSVMMESTTFSKITEGSSPEPPTFYPKSGTMTTTSSPQITSSVPFSSSLSSSTAFTLQRSGLTSTTTDGAVLRPRSVESAASSVDSSASSASSSIPSFFKTLAKEQESEELPLDMVLVPENLVTFEFGTGRFSEVRFDMAGKYATLLERLDKRFNIRWNSCLLRGPIRLIGTNNEYSLSSLRTDPYMLIQKGHSIEKRVSIGSRLHKVTVKIAQRLKGGKPFPHIWKETAALTILQGTGTVPALFEVDGLPTDCKDQVVVSSYYGYNNLRDMWTGRALPWEDLVKLAKRGISMLETVHNHGIVHGNIGWDTVVYRARDSVWEIAESMRFVDFEFSKVWVNVREKRGLTESQIEADDKFIPLSSWSAYRSSSENPRTLRDDLLGFMECIMMLGRTGPIDYGGATDGLHVAMNKRQFAVTEALGLTGGGLYRVFAMIYRLDFRAAPDYQGYIEILNGSV